MKGERHSRAELLRNAAAMAVALYGAAGRAGQALAQTVTAAQEASGVTLVTRDEPVTARSTAARGALEVRDTPPFRLLGLHWQGDGEVWFRARSAAGWTAWIRAASHEHADEAEGGKRGWHLGTPWWTEPSSAVQYRVAGRIERLRAHYVDSAIVPVRRLQTAAPPFVVLRSSWGADEKIVKGQPQYAKTLAAAIVHHTAGSTPKTPDESAAVIRAIQRYHVESNGWNDIGYNFLVDPFGQVFEGRAGGIDRNVVGAHALGFNTGSSGAALLGNFENRAVKPAERAALVGLLAWRLDVAHVDPLALVTLAGRSLRAVSGHRDVNATACPGANLYPDLAALASDAAALGLPKLYEPSARATPGSVRFGARLSEPRPWTVTVTDKLGGAVASGAGEGQIVDWTWTTTKNLGGVYRFAIEAGEDVRSATGSLTLGSPPPEQPPSPGNPPPPPERPSGIPRNIPGWARKLREWHLSPRGERGPRPKVRRRLPSWYWPWFRWRNQMDRWEEQYGKKRGRSG